MRAPPTGARLHVFSVCLADGPQAPTGPNPDDLQDLAVLRPYVPPTDWTRAQAMRVPGAGPSVIAARGLLAFGLGHVAGVALSALPPLVLTEKGMPLLPDDHPQLRAAGLGPHGFSLSHCFGGAVCTLLQTADRGWCVGVDQENIRQKRPLQALADSVFHPLEQAAFHAAIHAARPTVEEPPEPDTTFYRIWTLKEALTKALGQGFFMNFRSFAVGLSPLGLRAETEQTGTAARWHWGQDCDPSGRMTSWAVQAPTGGQNLTVHQCSFASARALGAALQDLRP